MGTAIEYLEKIQEVCKEVTVLTAPAGIRAISALVDECLCHCCATCHKPLIRKANVMVTGKPMYCHDCWIRNGNQI